MAKRIAFEIEEAVDYLERYISKQRRILIGVRDKSPHAFIKMTMHLEALSDVLEEVKKYIY